MLWLKDIVHLFQMFACLSVFSVPAGVEREGLDQNKKPEAGLPCPCFDSH
jgi:hypothetical protein